jgi:hypothetical protein
MIQVLECFIVDLERRAKTYIDFVLYIKTCIFAFYKCTCSCFFF